MSGDCEVRDNCVSSKNFPNSYGNGERCDITVLRDTSPSLSETFDIEVGFDPLTIGQRNIYGRGDLPHTLTVGDKITWSTDGSIRAQGWEICFEPLRTFSVKGDDCEFDFEAGCVSSKNFPSAFDHSDRCEVFIHKDVAVTWDPIFDVTSDDTLWHSSLAESSKITHGDQPSIFTRGDRIAWTGSYGSSENDIIRRSLEQQASGWKMCLTKLPLRVLDSMCEAPRGDYVDTCHSCYLQDCVLKCHCGFGKTWLDLKKRCRGKSVTNLGGALACPVASTALDGSEILDLYTASGEKGELLGFQGECEDHIDIASGECDAKSHRIFAETSDSTESTFNGMLWSFGQFLDHDLDFVAESEEEEHIVSVGDFDFHLAVSHCESSQGFGKRANEITSMLDLSSVYDDTNEAIRDASDRAKLLFEEEDVLPLAPERTTFICGDVRCSENPFLTAQHTLWAKHHNILVDELRSNGEPDNGETLYQLAKQINIATYQRVVMEEFVPTLVGDLTGEDAYHGFIPSLVKVGQDQQCSNGIWLPIQERRVTAELCMQLIDTLNTANVDACNAEFLSHSVDRGCMCVPLTGCDLEPAPRVNTYHIGPQHDVSISPLFAGAAYRLHALVQDQFHIDGNLHTLSRHFFKPESYIDHGKLDGWMDRLMQTKSHRFGSHMSHSLQHALFCDDENQYGQQTGCQDLAARNCARGMDMQLPTYNQARELFGLAPAQSFDALGINCPELESIYNDIDDVELFIGGSCEDPVAGAVLGETFLAIVKDQFLRLRDGDPNFALPHPRGQSYRTLREVLTITTSADATRFHNHNIFLFQQ